jgi:hypothetical protein
MPCARKAGISPVLGWGTIEAAGIHWSRGRSWGQLVARSARAAANVPLIGVLVAETLGSQQFQRQQALREFGYVEGQSIRFEIVDRSGLDP